jgi:hypothetical protein
MILLAILLPFNPHIVHVLALHLEIGSMSNTSRPMQIYTSQCFFATKIVLINRVDIVAHP